MGEHKEFMHSFQRYVLSIYQVTGRVPGAEGTAEKKTEMPAHLEVTFQREIVSKINGM